MSVIRIEVEPFGRLELPGVSVERGASVAALDAGVKAAAIRNSRMILAETEPGRIAEPIEIHETASGRSDRWAVVLLNDDYHSVDYVVWALLKTIPELTETDAALIMLEAHNTGKGVAAVCGREQAERYRSGLRLRQLGCEIEPGW